MNRPYVGQEKEKHCPTCDEETLHYYYHSGEWLCSEGEHA